MAQGAWPSSTILICIMSTQKQLLNHCSSLREQITSHYLNLQSQRHRKETYLGVNFPKSDFYPATE